MIQGIQEVIGQVISKLDEQAAQGQYEIIKDTIFP